MHYCIVISLSSIANISFTSYSLSDHGVRLANSKARIKPTAPLSVFDKENSIEFLLNSLYYLYNYYMVCALPSHTYHVTYHCDIM